MKKLSILAIVFSLVSCKVMQAPFKSLNEYEFVVYPRVVQKGDSCSLQYQFALKMKNGNRTLLTSVASKKTDEKLYYYFAAATSFLDDGKIHEIKLDPALVNYVKKDAVYWLNTDKSEVKLKIVEE